MRILIQAGLAMLWLLLCLLCDAQQLRLGKNPYSLQKSAILELESDNQGMLFPRISDTTLINALAPPDGMVIFHLPSRHLMVRSEGHWRSLGWTEKALANLTDVTLTAPATGQLLQYNGSRWVNTSPGFLTSIDTSNIPSFHLKVRGLFSAGTGIGYNNSTGLISNTGVISVNGNTGALTMDTGYISNFHVKARSLLSAGKGIDYSSSTGVISSKAPVYYSGTGTTAAVDAVTKVWIAEVANTATGIQTVNIPPNVEFANILGITLTAKGGSDVTNAPIAMITSNTTSSITIRVLESKTTAILLGGSAEGLEAHTNTNTRIYIRVEGN